MNAFLTSAGAQPVNLDPFRTLPSSTAKGAAKTGRLTNLTALTVDTSWWLRYRSTGNPDFGDTFPQFITITNRPTIPLQDVAAGSDEIQAIANSAALRLALVKFHPGESVSVGWVDSTGKRHDASVKLIIGPPL